jgi:hypothetical protein
LITKLKYIDIHNYWLKERKLWKDIFIIYVSTANKLVDGLIKALDHTKFNLFRV